VAGADRHDVGRRADGEGEAEDGGQRQAANETHGVPSILRPVSAVRQNRGRFWCRLSEIAQLFCQVADAGLTGAKPAVRITKKALAFLTCAAVGTLVPGTAWAGAATLVAARDATLVESAGGRLANGAGPDLFSGRTNQAEEGRRRALLHFDVAAGLPPGAVVTSARLVLTASEVREDPVTVALHRVLGDWSEGPSSAEGGRGAPAAAGDATWLHASYDAVPWPAAGGDFAAAPSAVRVVAGDGVYVWSSAALTADVQAWLDDPASNHGWIAIGDETVPGSVKRFGSRENAETALRPVLEVEFGRRLGACADRALPADALALCAAYCEHLRCAEVAPLASPRACERLAARFSRDVAGPLPCTIADADGDGVADEADNCPVTWNADQADADADSVGDACDNCPVEPNPGQEDGGGELGVGDACDCPCFTSLAVAALVTTLQDTSTYRDLLCIDTRVGKPLTAVTARRVDGTPCAASSTDCSALAVEFTEDNACQWNPPRPAAAESASGISDVQRAACRDAIRAGAEPQGLTCE
jgi:hypothetical protein